MLKKLVVPSVVLVGLLHLGFMVLEATQWNTSLGRKLTHLSEQAAGETVGVGMNMGLYNGFLGRPCSGLPSPGAFGRRTPPSNSFSLSSSSQVWSGPSRCGTRESSCSNRFLRSSRSCLSG